MRQCSKVFDDTGATLSCQFSEQVSLAGFAPRARGWGMRPRGHRRVLPARILPAIEEVLVLESRVEMSNGAAIHYSSGIQPL